MRQEEIDIDKLEYRIKVYGYILLGLTALFLLLKYCLPYAHAEMLFGAIASDFTFSELSPLPIMSIIISVILVVGIIGLITLSINKIVLSMMLYGSIAFYIIEWIIVFLTKYEATAIEMNWFGYFYPITFALLFETVISTLRFYNTYNIIQMK